MLLNREAREYWQCRGRCKQKLNISLEWPLQFILSKVSKRYPFKIKNSNGENISAMIRQLTIILAKREGYYEDLLKIDKKYRLLQPIENKGNRCV